MATINGDNGNNHLFGTSAGDLMHGFGGNDEVIGGSGNDTLYGDDGADTVGGGAGNDYVDGGTGPDRLVGGSGWDTLKGGTDNDFLDGGSGHDVLDGGAGDDILYAGTGNDQMFGGDGNDQMSDGYGINRFDGGAGNDTLRSWADLAGPDTLTGGADSDTFWFSTILADANVPDDWGTITDFDATGRDGDKIDLSDTFQLGKLTFVDTNGFSGNGSGEVRWQSSFFEGTTTVEIDLDGDGTVDGSITLQGYMALSADTFVL